jgi:hypothetical protein
VERIKSETKVAINFDIFLKGGMKGGVTASEMAK